MRSLLFFLLCFGFVKAHTQTLIQLEDSLVKYRSEVLNSTSDSARLAANNAFLNYMEKALKSQKIFAYPFKKLNNICTLTSPDGEFRLFNWNVAKTDYTHDYYCFILTKKGKLFELKAKTDASQQMELKTLDQNHWIGNLYYEIIPVKRNGKKYYTLLGWDGYSRTVTQKIVDAMSFSGKKIKFGASLFKMEKKTQKRVIFKYSSEVTISLRYNKKQKRIVFDHLAPVNDNLKGIFDFYGPDMSYDALVWKNGKWHYEKDIDIRKNANRKGKPFTSPE